MTSKILFHLAGGIGNMIMATPAIQALASAGDVVDLFVQGDSADSIELFNGWTAAQVVTSREDGIPDVQYDYYLISWLVNRPIDIPQIRESIHLGTSYQGVDGRRMPEYEMYMHFARAINREVKANETKTFCGASERRFSEISENTLVLSPGCQERFPIKRWDKFPELAGHFDDVALVGTPSDLSVRYSFTYPSWIKNRFQGRLRSDGRVRKILNMLGAPYNQNMKFPNHVKNYIGRLSLADTAALIRQAGTFVGNDGGLAHVAAGVGTPTYIIFGPTDVAKNTVPMEHVHVIQKGLGCQPCQFGGKHPEAFASYYIGCPVKMQCMRTLTVRDVVATLDLGR
jgi:hypothetical protein